MPKIFEMIESKFLKKEEVGEDGTIVTIVSFDKVNVAQEDAPAEHKWVMHVDEFPKPLVINSTNLKLCEQALGSDDTDDWIGKQVILYNDPNITFGGKLTGGIRVKAHRKVAPPRQINKPSQSIVRNKLPADDDPGYDPTAFSSPDDLLEVR